MTYAFDGATMWMLRQDDYDGNTNIDGNECVDPFLEADGTIACAARSADPRRVNLAPSSGVS